MSPATLPAEKNRGSKPAPQPQAGRDSRGRFTPCNPGGPGNPFARQVAQLRSTILQHLSTKDIGNIIEAVKVKAVSGDLVAAKLLLQYAVGKPAPPSTRTPSTSRNTSKSISRARRSWTMSG